MSDESEESDGRDGSDESDISNESDVGDGRDGVMVGMGVVLATGVMLVMGEFPTTAPPQHLLPLCSFAIIETSVFFFSISTPGLVLI